MQGEKSNFSQHRHEHGRGRHDHGRAGSATGVIIQTTAVLEPLDELCLRSMSTSVLIRPRSCSSLSTGVVTLTTVVLNLQKTHFQPKTPFFNTRGSDTTCWDFGASLEHFQRRRNPRNMQGSHPSIPKQEPSEETMEKRHANHSGFRKLPQISNGIEFPDEQVATEIPSTSNPRTNTSREATSVLAL